MKNILEINLKLYHLHVIVTFGLSLDAVIKHARSRGCSLSEEWIKDLKDHVDGANGFCSNLGPNNTDVLVWMKNVLHSGHTAKDYGTLFHELFHAVDKITKSHGMEAEQECRAYIYEHLAEECCRFCWTKKAPNNKAKS